MGGRGRDSLRWNGRVWVAQIDLGRRPDGRQVKRKTHLDHPNTADGERAARADMGEWIGQLGEVEVGNGVVTVSHLIEEWRRLTSANWSDHRAYSRDGSKPRLRRAL